MERLAQALRFLYNTSSGEKFTLTTKVSWQLILDINLMSERYLAKCSIQQYLVGLSKTEIVLKDLNITISFFVSFDLHGSLLKRY